MVKRAKAKSSKKAAKTPKRRAATKASSAKASAMANPNWLLGALNSPLAREAAAAALIAGAGAAAAVLARGGSGKGAGNPLRQASSVAKDLKEAAADVVADVASNAMRGMLPSPERKREDH